jgi:hypothetical protein
MKKRWEFRKTMRNDTLKIHVAFFFCSDAMCFFFCFYTLFCSALQRIVYMWECIFFWRFLSIKLSKKKPSIEKIKAHCSYCTWRDALCFSLERTVCFLWSVFNAIEWSGHFCRSIPIDMSFPTMHQLILPILMRQVISIDKNIYTQPWNRPLHSMISIVRTYTISCSSHRCAEQLSNSQPSFLTLKRLSIDFIFISVLSR